MQDAGFQQNKLPFIFAAMLIGTQNFNVAMREWNRSELYRKTIVYFAQRIAR